MFLHYILTRTEDELLTKFFRAQLREPTKNDWVSQIKDDLIDLDIEDDFDEIKNMTKAKFSKLVKDAYKEKAFDDLLLLQENHSKGSNLVYGELKMRRHFKQVRHAKSKL